MGKGREEREEGRKKRAERRENGEDKGEREERRAKREREREREREKKKEKSAPWSSMAWARESASRVVCASPFRRSQAITSSPWKQLQGGRVCVRSVSVA